MVLRQIILLSWRMIFLYILVLIYMWPHVKLIKNSTSLNPKLIVAVQLVPVLRAKNGRFRIWLVVEKQLRHNSSGVILRGVNPCKNFDWPYLSHYLIYLQNPAYQNWRLEQEGSNITSSTQIGPKTEKYYSWKSKLGRNMNSSVTNRVGQIRV